ncbi:VpaChn25_0724 family phage protein [Rhodovarius crocodyli]
MKSNIPDGVLEIAREHRALATLRLLDRLGPCSNAEVLQGCLGLIGLRGSRDSFIEQLHALAEQKLITLEKCERVHVVELTARGADVAAGRLEVPGVAKAYPECPY